MKDLDLLEKLESFKILDAGWSGWDGSKPITEAAIESAKSFIECGAVTPMCDGGIEIELFCCFMELSIEIKPDGKLGNFYFEPVEEPMITE